jgi:hypothetical protein
MKPALAITGTICAAIATAAAISAFSARTHLADSQKTPGTGRGSLFLPPGAGSAAAVVSLKDGLLIIAAEKVKLRDIPDRERETTGAKVDAPALDLPVTAHLGPQPPAQVIADQTGGDEGVWDDVDVGTLLNPVGSSHVATESSPAQADPRSSSIATPSQD